MSKYELAMLIVALLSLIVETAALFNQKKKK